MTCKKEGPTKWAQGSSWVQNCGDVFFFGGGGGKKHGVVSALSPESTKVAERCGPILSAFREVSRVTSLSMFQSIPSTSESQAGLQNRGPSGPFDSFRHLRLHPCFDWALSSAVQPWPPQVKRTSFLPSSPPIPTFPFDLGQFHYVIIIRFHLCSNMFHFSIFFIGPGCASLVPIRLIDLRRVMSHTW